MIPTSPDFLLARNPRNTVINGGDAKEHNCGDGIESNCPLQ